MSKPKIQSLEINLSLCQNKQSLESPPNPNTNEIPIQFFPNFFCRFKKLIYFCKCVIFMKIDYLMER